MLYTFANIIYWCVMYLGCSILILSASITLLGIAWCIGATWNRISWKLADMYGGLKVFKEYREWYISKNKGEQV